MSSQSYVRPATRRTRNRGKDPFGSYLYSLDHISLLTVAEERALVERIASGDKDARDHLIRANLRLVVYVARVYVDRGLSMDDLIGEGNAGLIVAADRYRLDRGTKFSSYATHWIKQSIRKALRSTTAPIRIPVYIWDWLAQLRRDSTFVDTLTAKQQRRLGLAIRALKRRKEIETEELTDREPIDGELPGEIAALLDVLTPLERRVIVGRYSLDGRKKLFLRQLGEELGVTREWVRLIELRAKDKLREAAEQAGIGMERIAG